MPDDPLQTELAIRGAEVEVGRFAILTRRPFVTLAFLCIVLWLPGILSLPPLDRDESRFAQSSKQMLESGDFVDIRFGQVPRYKKPVGIYWMQAATTAVAGLGERGDIWTYRLASLLGGIAAVWLTFACSQTFVSREAALLGAALLGASLLTSAEATIATTDAVLLACFLGAQTVLMRVYLAARDVGREMPSRGVVLAGWAGLGASILIKGPVAPAACLVTVLGLSLWDRDVRWLRGLRSVSGIALAIVIVAPWLVAIAIQSRGAFLQQSLGNDFAAKLAGGQETHGAPPGYFLALVTLTFWPGTLFLLPAIGLGIVGRREPVIRFLLVWAALTWLMFELVPTKLPHYVLPAYPALAMLAALWVDRAPMNKAGWLAVLYRIAPFQFLIGSGAIVVAAVMLPALYSSSGIVPAALAGAVIGASFTIAACALYVREALRGAALSAIVAALVLYPTLTLGVAPQLTQLWVSPRAASLVAALKRSGDPPPSLAGYEEPSLFFLLGTQTRLTDGGSAAAEQAQQGGVALIEDHERDAYLSRIASLGIDTRKMGEVSGLDYSRGKIVHIGVYRAVPMRYDPSSSPE